MLICLLLLPLAIAQNPALHPESPVFQQDKSLPSVGRSEPITLSNDAFDPASPDFPFTHFFTTVVVSSCQFVDFSAVGRSTSHSSGGVFYCAHAQVSIDRSNFSFCSAMFGGCLYLVSSCLSCSETSFDGSLAFHAGGAMAATIYGPVSMYSVFWIQIAACKFRNCTAREFCGALLITRANDVVIESSWFGGCTSGGGGGAIGFKNSNALLFRSTFYNNSCGAVQSAVFKGLDPAASGELSRPSQALLTLRVGGAIWISSDASSDPVTIDMTDANAVQFEVGTEDCCFLGNSIKGDLGTAERAGIEDVFDTYWGHDVGWTGDVRYQSYHDRFLNFRRPLAGSDPRPLAIQGGTRSSSSANALTSPSAPSVYRSYFALESQFFDDFPACVLELGNGLDDVRALYAAYDPPTVYYWSAEYSKDSVPDDGATSEPDVSEQEPGPDPPPAISREPLPTLAGAYSLRKVLAAEADKPSFVDGGDQPGELIDVDQAKALMSIKRTH